MNNDKIKLANDSFKKGYISKDELAGILHQEGAISDDEFSKVSGKPPDYPAVAKSAVRSAVSPMMPGEKNLSMRGAREWQGLPPSTQRSLGYLAATIVLPEMAPEAIGGTQIPLILKTLMRGGLAAGGSALKDVATGAPINKRDLAITAGSEGLGGALEAGGRAAAPYIPELAEKFARIKRPVLDVAKKYGSKFSEAFPGTDEAIRSGAGKASEYFNKIAQSTRTAREAVYNAASGKVAQKESQYAADVATHEKTVDAMKTAFEQAKSSAVSARDRAYMDAMEKAMSDHSSKIQGLSSGLSDRAQTLQKAGSDLRTGSMRRGITVDPVEELKKSNIVASGKGNRMAIGLPSRLPSDIGDLEIRLKNYLTVEKQMNPKESLVEAVRLKKAFQDLKHVQGGLNYAENESVNAYANLLDKTVSRLDPEYSSLEKNYSQALKEYDRHYDKSKRIFDDLRQGEEIGIPRDMLPKSGDFKPQEVPSPEYPQAPQRPDMKAPKMLPSSKLEKKPYGGTSGEMAETIYKAMHPVEGSGLKAKETMRRLGRAPGTEEASGNIAAKDLRSIINRGMIYPVGSLGALSMASGLGALSSHPGGKRKALGSLGVVFAMSGLVRAALQSPALYRTIVTNPELLRAIVTRVPWASKVFVAADQK